MKIDHLSQLMINHLNQIIIKQIILKRKYKNLSITLIWKRGQLSQGLKVTILMKNQ